MVLEFLFESRDCNNTSTIQYLNLSLVGIANIQNAQQLFYTFQVCTLCNFHLCFLCILHYRCNHQSKCSQVVMQNLMDRTCNLSN
jgi:hypothetical protein